MSYNCPNRDPYSGEWICFCPSKDKSAKEHLSKLFNGWIIPLIERAKKKCQDHNFTEQDALKEIAYLEEEASGNLAMWKWGN